MSAPLFEHPTPEERPYVEAVRSAPAELAPRAAFANWLIARGDERGSWLRASIELEMRRETLGLGYLFAGWRDLLAEWDFDGPLKELSSVVAQRATPTSRELAEPFSHLFGVGYVGGFLENIRVGLDGLAGCDCGLSDRVPLRGVEMFGRRTAAEFDALSRLSRRAPIERLAIELPEAWPFDDRTLYDERTVLAWLRDGFPELRAIAAFGPEDASATPVTALVGRILQKPIESALFVGFRSSFRTRFDRLLHAELPELRCLGFVHCGLTDADVAELAKWKGLRTVRLLDLSENPIGWRG